MKPLVWVILAVSAFVLGLVLGVWTGGRIEQEAFVAILTHTALSQDCRDEVEAAAKDIMRNWEKDAATPSR